MARSSFVLVLGLLVAGLAFPALAALPDSQVWQFAATGGGSEVAYSGHNSPAFVAGYVSANANAWNTIRPGVTNAESYYNTALTGGINGMGFHTADNVAPTGDVLFNSGGGYPVRGPIQFQGGLDIQTNELNDVVPASWGWGPSPRWIQSPTGVFSPYYAESTTVRSNPLMQRACQAGGLSGNQDQGVRYNGFQPGTYRVFVGSVGPANANWLSDITIAAGELNAKQSDTVRVGYDNANGTINNNWVAGQNFTAKTITITDPSQWISVLVSPANDDPNMYGGWPMLNSVQIVKLVTGDADLNGKVDFQDYLALESSFGNTVTHGTGADFDNNGVIDFQDYLALESNFGAGAVVETPEPMTLSLLGLGALALIRRRK